MRFWEEKEKSSGRGQELVVMFLLLDFDPECTKKRREKLRGENTEPASRDGFFLKPLPHGAETHISSEVHPYIWTLFLVNSYPASI